jgi:hypothetical protein
MHRAVMNAPVGLWVDHINGNRLDNRKENLRLVTPEQNNWNHPGFASRRASKYKGVKKYGKNRWEVNINHRGIAHRFGPFTRETDAARAYNEAARSFFGEYAFQNKIDS